LRDIREAKTIENLPFREKYKRYCSKFRVFTNEPRHLLRAIQPSVSDVIFGHRLGILAVDNAMAGYTDFMVSQWLTEYVLVPLELVVLGRKRVPQEGIFWKSVLAKTGTADLFYPSQ
jgi:6-phosphofructokinase